MRAGSQTAAQNPSAQRRQLVEDAPLEAAPAEARPPGASGRWLLLIHQVPTKPDYFRVKVRRRLQRLGAIALKNSVYVLPNGDGPVEDFQWLRREITAEGGEAVLCAAALVDGVTDAELEAMFRRDRDADYAEIVEGAGQLARSQDRASVGDAPPAELARLARRLTEVVAIDYFRAPGRGAAEAALAAAEARFRPAAPAPGAGSGPDASDRPIGCTWVTRRGVHVDRIASAWLIRRFIDPAAQFAFGDVGDRPYRPAPGELRFDMFEAEYTHEGPRCTFETLLARFGLADPALVALGEIVHDIDVKESTFGRPETPGVAAMIAGIAATSPSDDARLARGAEFLDALYAALGAALAGRAAER